jgi:hypothetical protein
MTGWLKVAPVRTGYTYFGDVRRRCPGRDGHIRRDLMADRHRPKIHPVRAKAGLRMDAYVLDVFPMGFLRDLKPSA